jgi:hypothetical protein
MVDATDHDRLGESKTELDVSGCKSTMVNDISLKH